MLQTQLATGSHASVRYGMANYWHRVKQLGGGLVFLIGLGGIADDLANWKQVLQMILERGWLSWLLMIGGLMLLLSGYKDLILQKVQAVQQRLPALSAITLPNVCKDGLYLMAWGLGTVVPILFLLRYAFSITPHPIVVIASSLAVSISLHIRRLRVTGRDDERDDVIYFWLIIGGVFLGLLMLGLMLTIVFEISVAFRGWLHQDVE